MLGPRQAGCRSKYGRDGRERSEQMGGGEKKNKEKPSGLCALKRGTGHVKAAAVLAS